MRGIAQKNVLFYAILFVQEEVSTILCQIILMNHISEEVFVTSATSLYALI